MSSKYIMAIDQGTTGTTVCLIDARGQMIVKVNKEFTQIYPQPGWVEHDPEEIWKTVLWGIKESLKKAKVKGNQIVALGITNQRETALVWDRKTGIPIYNAIVWQCRRTTDFCNQLKNKGFEKTVRKKTGLVLDPYFSASKYRWILKNVKGAGAKARKGRLAAGTIDSFLLWKLTGGQAHKTEISNASRTSLMNIKTGGWDKDLLKLFSIPSSLLPSIEDSNALFGTVKGISGLPDGLPINGIAGDQQAALFGQTCFSVGDAKCTYGTGSFLLMNTGDKPVFSQKGLLTTVAWKLREDKKITYALEGGAFICGAAVQWLRDGLKIIEKSSDIESLALKAKDSQGVDFVPALAGLGAPYWAPSARGLMTGLTRGVQQSHIARATLDAMALQNLDILKAMEQDLGKRLKHLRVDGGASSNALLMQLQADYLQNSIERPQMVETTVAGAAYLAGIGVGFWKNKEALKKVWKSDAIFHSKISKKQSRARIEQWHKAIERVLI